MVGLRTLTIRGIGMVGNVVLARLLAPSSFGIVALGYVVITAAGVITDGGLGAAMIRAPSPPSREDLAAVTGFQLAGTMLIVAVTGAVTAVVGGHAFITLLMICSLPIMTLQTPAALALERELVYRPLVMADLSQTITYNVWAIVSVAAFGAGVWGLASATVAGAIVGTIVIWTLAPMRLVLPTLSLRRVRPMLSFGMRFQAIGLLGLGRDHGLNSLTGAIGGLATLGLWSLTYRLLQPGMLVFETLRRISYPGMARLSELGQDLNEMVTRSLAMTTVAAGFVLAPLAASARALVPSVFGARWAPCADVLTLSAWAMLPQGALSVAAAGFLLASGKADETLRIVVAHTIVGLTFAAVLLPTQGINAIGYAFVAMSVTDVVMFSRALLRHVPGFDPFRSIGPGMLVSTAATVSGWLATRALGTDLLAAAVGVLTALTVTIVGYLIVERPTLISLRQTAAGAVGLRGQTT